MNKLFLSFGPKIIKIFFSKETWLAVLMLQALGSRLQLCYKRSRPTQYPVRDVFERFQLHLYWQKYLKDLSETSQEWWLVRVVFKTSKIPPKMYFFAMSKIHFKRDAFYVTPLTLLKSIFCKSLLLLKNNSQKWFCVISIKFMKYLIK